MARISAVLFPGKAAGVSSSHSLSFSFVLAILFLGLPNAQCQISKMYFEVDTIDILVDETRLFKLVQIGQENTTFQLAAQIQHADIVQIVPETIDIPGTEDSNATVKLTYDLCAYGKSPGHSEVIFNATPAVNVDVDSLFLRVTVMHSHEINIISYIMGWMYFAAWSISFYPQIYINFKRKSVVGLNFDFLALNIMGFTMYSLFNCGLYFSEVIQSQYFARHPRGLNPVQLNDVFFSLHASFATIITIVQCFIYEREDQRVSLTTRGILGVFVGVLIVSGSLGVAAKIEWLDFLSYCSYIKLCISFIKYVPQAYMNYRRKSTVGWSIGNIFLDFVGGLLSVLQMALNAYNYNDWISFFGDVTKFGMGFFSLVFDVFFMLQHYVFYREGKEFVVDESSDEDSNTSRSGVGSEYYLVSTWQARYIVLPGTSYKEESEDSGGEYEDETQYLVTPYQGAPA